MNLSKTIENQRKVGDDSFILIYSRRDVRNLNDYLHLFNFDDYWCFKTTRKQILISYEEFLDFKYTGYIFFKKDLYDLDHIQNWVNWMNGIGGIMFLVKPLPPFSTDKIIIRK
jgi:hypothetical protein